MPLADIDTIVVVMLENRSFDHMCGYLSLPGAAPPLPVDGLRPGSTWSDPLANEYGGKVYPLNRLGPEIQAIDDPTHDHTAIQVQIAQTPAGGAPAQMGGFVESYARFAPTPPADLSRVMGYYDAESVPIFDFFARHFVICDRWFAPLPTGTQANRLMAMGGESRVLDDVHVLPQQDLVYDWLTKNGVRWCAYQSGGMFPFFSLMPSWEAEIATSLAYSLTGGRGRFRLYDRFREEWMDPAPMPQVIFIEPEYTNGPHHDPNDDHPPTGVAKGQALVSDIYGILIANPARWANTVLIVSYDEHGGFFDHVPPLPIAGSGGGYPFATSGVRVPAFVVSPHVASGKAHSRPLDHTSILQLLAERFTPGRDYSPAVAARQPQLSPLSAVFEPSATLRRPAPAAATVSALNSVAAAAPVPPAAGADLGDATTAQAFHLLADRIVQRHPDLPIALNATTPPSVSSPSPSGNT